MYSEKKKKTMSLGPDSIGRLYVTRVSARFDGNLKYMSVGTHHGQIFNIYTCGLYTHIRYYIIHNVECCTCTKNGAYVRFSRLNLRRHRRRRRNDRLIAGVRNSLNKIIRTIQHCVRHD